MRAHIIGVGETARIRHPDPSVTTLSLIRDAARNAVRDADIPFSSIDGLAIASFTLEPDRAIDVAWRLGLSLNWLLQDNNGGASGINMLSHTVRAIEAGAANNILIVGAGCSNAGDFHKSVMNYNSATRDHLAPLEYGGPNALFAMLTTRQMRMHSLSKVDYGYLVLSQREWASRNPIAAFRGQLTMEDYLSAPIVANPLCRYDCVPIVAGASALIVSGKVGPHSANPVRVASVRQRFNHDHQDGDGLQTGIRAIADGLWQEANVGPEDIHVASIYDDYPAMVYAQLADLGIIRDGDIARFARDTVAHRRLPVNTGGGMLSCGQAGSGSGVHGIAEVTQQLRNRCGGRQVPDAHIGVVSGYGMALYRYCACAGAAVLVADADSGGSGN
jgi:acetyl-CoA acetyltransferase